MFAGIFDQARISKCFFVSDNICLAKGQKFGCDRKCCISSCLYSQVLMLLLILIDALLGLIIQVLVNF